MSTPIRHLQMQGKENAPFTINPRIATSPMLLKPGSSMPPQAGTPQQYGTPGKVIYQHHPQGVQSSTAFGMTPLAPLNPMLSTTTRRLSGGPAGSTGTLNAAKGDSDMDLVNLRFENVSLRQEKDKWQLACGEMEQDVSVLLRDFETLGKALVDAKSRAEQTTRAESDARKQYDEMSKLLDKATSREETHVAALDAQKVETEKWQMKFKQLHADAQNKLKQAHALNEEYKSKAAKFDETKAMLTRKCDDLASAAKSIEELERRCQQAETSNAMARDQAARINDENERLRGEERSLRLEVYAISIFILSSLKVFIMIWLRSVSKFTFNILLTGTS
jgi:predicted  nucleic acid-binding Zn-ribbon protein